MKPKSQDKSFQYIYRNHLNDSVLIVQFPSFSQCFLKKGNTLLTNIFLGPHICQPIQSLSHNYSRPLTPLYFTFE